jgi:hypothetical protein
MKLNDDNQRLPYREASNADPVSDRAQRGTGGQVRTNHCLKFKTMQAVAVSVLALCVAHTGLSAESPPTVSAPRLAGIVSLAARPCAVLEVTHLRHSSEKWLILSEGQREEDVEVMKIAPEQGSVELGWQGTSSTTVRLKDTTNLPVPGVVLEDVGISVVLQLFAQFTNRTLLRWPHLQASVFSLRAVAQDRADAARILEKALLAEDLSIIPDGEKFLMIVPKSKATMVKPHAPSARSSAGSETNTPAASPGTGNTGEEPLLPGMIDFRNADLAQVVDIYAMMLHRQFDHSKRLPVSGTICLTTQTSLTKEEGVYALETLLLWSGLKMVQVGEDRLKAVRDPEY